VAYAGDLGPAETYDLLRKDGRAVLIDVRTRAEWAYVGTPDLRELGRDVVLIEWTTFPDGQRNPEFLAELEQAGVERDAPLAFICRSGQRSRRAAELATAAGYTTAYNVAEGFEGPVDDAGHRGTNGGWKAAGLPWRQS
jgi:rhodanese-related sulfurtransferase